MSERELTIHLPVRSIVLLWLPRDDGQSSPVTRVQTPAEIWIGDYRMANHIGQPTILVTIRYII